jgi:hypothetical protein
VGTTALLNNVKWSQSIRYRGDRQLDILHLTPPVSRCPVNEYGKKVSEREPCDWNRYFTLSCIVLTLSSAAHSGLKANGVRVWGTGAVRYHYE